MATIKFSEFDSGNISAVGTLLVGLESGINKKFTASDLIAGLASESYVDSEVLTLQNQITNNANDIANIADTDSQTLSWDLATSALSISNGNTVDLSGLRVMIDANFSNISILQSQVISLESNVSVNAGDIGVLQGNVISIEAELANIADTDNQTLSYDGSTASLSISNGNSVILQEVLDNAGNIASSQTDIINLSLNQNSISSDVGNNAGNITVIQGQIADLQANGNIQTLSLDNSSNVLSISAGNNVDFTTVLGNVAGSGTDTFGTTISIANTSTDVYNRNGVLPADAKGMAVSDPNGKSGWYWQSPGPTANPTGLNSFQWKMFNNDGPQTFTVADIDYIYMIVDLYTVGQVYFNVYTAGVNPAPTAFQSRFSFTLNGDFASTGRFLMWAKPPGSTITVDDVEVYPFLERLELPYDAGASSGTLLTSEAIKSVNVQTRTNPALTAGEVEFNLKAVGYKVNNSYIQNFDMEIYGGDQSLSLDDSSNVLTISGSAGDNTVDFTTVLAGGGSISSVTGGTNITTVLSGSDVTVNLDPDINVTGNIDAGNINIYDDILIGSGTGGSITGASSISAESLIANSNLSVVGFLVDGVIDDDTMATASATTLATSESVKAYVDANAGSSLWDDQTTFARYGNEIVVGSATETPNNLNANYSGITVAGASGGAVNFTDGSNLQGRIFGSTNGLEIRAVTGKPIQLDDPNGIEVLSINSDRTVTFGWALDDPFTFPMKDGLVNQALITDGSGTVTWQDVSGGGFDPLTDEIVIGNGASTSGNSGIAIGHDAAAVQNWTTAVGSFASATGQYTTAIGNMAGNSSTTGAVYSTFVGDHAGSWSSGGYAIGIGNMAAGSGSANQIIGIGRMAGRVNTADNSIAIGDNAGNSGHGEFSIAIGFESGKGGTADNTIGINATGTTVAVGSQFGIDIRTSAAGSLTYNTANAWTFGSNVTVTGNITPSANVTYDLGSETNRWKDLWLSGNTIHLGDATISTDDGALIVDGVTMENTYATTSSVANTNTEVYNSNGVLPADPKGMAVADPNGAGGWYWQSPGPSTPAGLNSFQWKMFNNNGPQTYTVADIDYIYMVVDLYTVGQVYFNVYTGTGPIATTFTSRFSFTLNGDFANTGRFLMWAKPPGSTTTVDDVEVYPFLERLELPYAAVASSGPLLTSEPIKSLNIQTRTNPALTAGEVEFNLKNVGYKVTGGNIQNFDMDISNPFDQDVSTTDTPEFQGVTATTGTVRLASLTSTERDNLTPVNGDMIYNTTDSKLQGYQAGIWINLDGS